MTSPDFIDRWSELSSAVPVMESSFWDRNYKDERTHVLLSQIKKSVTYSFHPLWRTVEQVLYRGIADYVWHILDRNTSAEDFDINTILKDTDETLTNVLKMSWEMDINESRTGE